MTGAGSPQGIGFATAKLLAEMGAQVAIAATGQRIHKRAAKLEQASHTARGYIADLTDRSAARSMIEAVESDFGKIDILVNNAGMTMEGAPPEGLIKQPAFPQLEETRHIRLCSCSISKTI